MRIIFLAIFILFNTVLYGQNGSSVVRPYYIDGIKIRGSRNIQLPTPDKNDCLKPIPSLLEYSDFENDYLKYSRDILIDSSADYVTLYLILPDEWFLGLRSTFDSILTVDYTYAESGQVFYRVNSSIDSNSEIKIKKIAKSISKMSFQLIVSLYDAAFEKVRIKTGLNLGCCLNCSTSYLSFRNGIIHNSAMTTEFGQLRKMQILVEIHNELRNLMNSEIAIINFDKELQNKIIRLTKDIKYNR